VLPSGTELITLPDAIRHFSETVPKREHKHPRVLLAANALTPPRAEPRSDCLG
jgi:hypothetical protein